jgi:hypothetical protein
MSEYTYRTFNLHPCDYERELADALFEIMGKSVHDLGSIVAELNRAGSKPKGGVVWTVEGFKAEMQRLGTWSHSIGAPVGAHGVPGASRRAHGQ